MREPDLSSSCVFTDEIERENRIIVGSDVGFVGEAFAKDHFNNWVPSTGTKTGTVTSSTNNTISDSTATFNTTEDGIIGNWCVITNADGTVRKLCKISGVTSTQLTFSVIANEDGTGGTTFLVNPPAGSKYFIGIIECIARKYFNLGSPTSNKTLQEIWVTMENVNLHQCKYYPEFTRSNATVFILTQGTRLGGGSSNAWLKKSGLPSSDTKSFGLEVVERGYSQFILRDISLWL